MEAKLTAQTHDIITQPHPAFRPNNTPFDRLNEKHNTLFFPVAERQLAWHRRDGSFDPMSTHKAIIRLSPDGKSASPINVVNATYKLIHNRELFTGVEDTMCNELGLPALKDVSVKDAIAHGGRTCIRQYVFPSVTCKPTMRSGSIKSDIAFRIILRNSYGGSAIRMYAGAIEFYCTNGMLLGQHDAAYFRHTAGLQIAGINLAIKRSLDTFVDKQEVWAKWADTPVQRAATIEFFRSISASPRQFDLFQTRWLEEREDRGSTAWSVYSTLTNFSSHPRGEFAPRRTTDQNDTIAATMLHRELQVQKWVESSAWARLMETA